MSYQLPIPLEFRRCMPVKKEVGEEGKWKNRERSWVLCLEAFVSPLQVGILGEVSGEGFSRIFISFTGMLF